MTLYKVDKTLKFLSGYRTYFNTGWNSGFIAWLEKILRRKLTEMIC